VDLRHGALLGKSAFVSDLDIFLTRPNWEDALDAVSRILGSNGVVEGDAIGRRCVWRVVCLQVVAIDNPQLDDDQGIPFSTFTTELTFLINDRIDLEREESLRNALALLVFVRLRRELDAQARLVRNLQHEIIVK
jgi:hypothetical protein